MNHSPKTVARSSAAKESGGNDMLYHASLFPVKKFVPRIPLVRCENEDETFPRISFSEEDKFHAISAIPSIGENISMMLELGLYPTLYLYTYPETACRIVHSICQEPMTKVTGLCLTGSGFTNE